MTDFLLTFVALLMVWRRPWPCLQLSAEVATHLDASSSNFLLAQQVTYTACELVLPLFERELGRTRFSISQQIGEPCSLIFEDNFTTSYATIQASSDNAASLLSRRLHLRRYWYDSCLLTDLTTYIRHRLPALRLRDEVIFGGGHLSQTHPKM